MKKNKSIFVICCLICLASFLPANARILRYYPNQLEWMIVWLNSQYATTSSSLNMRFYPTYDDNIVLRVDYWLAAYPDKFIDELLEWAKTEALDDMRFRGLYFRLDIEKRKVTPEKGFTGIKGRMPLIPEGQADD